MEKAYKHLESGNIKCIEVRAVDKLCQIHKYHFKELYDLVRKIHTQNIKKGVFRFSNFIYIDAILSIASEGRPDYTLLRTYNRAIKNSLSLENAKYIEWL